MTIKRIQKIAALSCLACLVNLKAGYGVVRNNTDKRTRSSSRCFAMPATAPLQKNVARADVIATAELIKYTADTSWQAPKTFAGSASLKLPGLYVFQVLRMYKGQCDPTLLLNLPPVLMLYYDTVKMPVEVSDHVLLLLKSDGGGRLSPVDPTVPLIRLANGQESPPDDSHVPESVESRVVGLLLASLSDDALRGPTTYFLRNVIDPRIPVATKPYLNDPDLRIQDHILSGLAINQQVTAIPLIAALEHKLTQFGSGTRSVGELYGIEDRAALPYLNPLLWDSDYFVRFNAVSPINRFTDSSSIPYLILALRDPDPQNVIPFNAYQALHRIISSLGPAKDWSLFQIQRKEESRKLNAWWSDELSGKHAQTPRKKENTPAVTVDVSELTVGQLNLLLFEPSPASREAAIGKLKTLADHSSVPFLILALQDPDKKIGYDAYEILHRLLPALGRIKTRDSFEKDKENTLLPIYDWWEDELMERHVRMPAGGNVPGSSY